MFASIDETISYQMPTVTLDGKYLVYVAAWKNHIGLYPVPPLSDDHHHAEHSPSSCSRSPSPRGRQPLPGRRAPPRRAGQPTGQTPPTRNRRAL